MLLEANPLGSLKGKKSMEGCQWVNKTWLCCYIWWGLKSRPFVNNKENELREIKKTQCFSDWRIKGIKYLVFIIVCDILYSTIFGLIRVIYFLTVDPIWELLDIFIFLLYPCELTSDWEVSEFKVLRDKETKELTFIC